MISKEIVKTLVDFSDYSIKDVLLKEFINEFIADNSYNDDKVNHLLELLIGKANYIGKEDINLEYIKENMSKFIYNGESYSFQNVLIDKVSDINNSVTMSYQYKNKDDSEDDWRNSYVNIDMDEYPECVKK